jgi:hypothetical protein
MAFCQDRARDTGPRTRADPRRFERPGYGDPIRRLHHLPTTGLLVGRSGCQEESFMMTRMSYRQIYVRTVLNLYIQLPHTRPPARLRDRALAAHFFDRQIPIDIVETALLLGSARRIFRHPASAPIRSLHYFEPIIEELLPHGFPTDYRHGSWFQSRYVDDVADHDPELPF